MTLNKPRMAMHCSLVNLVLLPTFQVNRIKQSVQTFFGGAQPSVQDIDIQIAKVRNSYHEIELRQQHLRQGRKDANHPPYNVRQYIKGELETGLSRDWIITLVIYTFQDIVYECVLPFISVIIEVVVTDVA